MPTRRVASRNWTVPIAIAVMVLASVPYIYGFLLQGTGPEHAWYSGFAYDIADCSVYLSWIRQAADGDFFQRNLFTTDPQSGGLFNLFFLLLGVLTRVTGLPAPVFFHIARFLLGIAFLRSAWWLLELLVIETRARLAGFLILCFSAGIGWVALALDIPRLAHSLDIWQPEALTFPSLYFSPLFAISLLLMVGVIGWLRVAEQSRSYRAAFYSGICGLLLGNIHTYDVITVGSIWGIYLLMRRLKEGSWDVDALRHALLSGALTAITTGYTAWQILTDEVFAKRAAVPTLSPSLPLYITGYGLVLLLALAGAWWLYRRGEVWRTGAATGSEVTGQTTARNAGLLLVVWAVVNVAITFIPISFQRRLLMGEHLALSALAGIALAWIFRGSSPARWRTMLGLVLFVTFLSNAAFMARDMSKLRVNDSMDRVIRPYLRSGERDALLWIEKNLPPGAALQPVPLIGTDTNGSATLIDISVASYTPGLTGHPVHIGHWGETPDFETKVESWGRFQQTGSTDEWRRDFIAKTGVRYLLVTRAAGASSLPPLPAGSESWLRRIDEGSNDDAILYEVMLDRQALGDGSGE